MRVKESDGRGVDGSACLLSEMINIAVSGMGYLMIIRDLNGCDI